MKKDIRTQLESWKQTGSFIQPDQAWVSKGRQRLLSQIENTVSRDTHSFFSWNGSADFFAIFVPARLRMVARYGMTMILISLLAIGGWIASVSASYNSLPGETLYAVKRLTEGTELLVASTVGNDHDKVSTLLKHASTRVDEIKKSTTPAQAKEAIGSLKKSIESTNKTLKHVEQQSPEQAIAVAKVVNEKTEEILKSLDDGKATVKPSADTSLAATANTESVSKSLQETTNLIEKTGVKAVEVLVEKNFDTKDGPDLREAQESVEKKLAALVQDSTKLSQEIGEVASSSVGITVPVSTSTGTPVLPFVPSIVLPATSTGIAMTDTTTLPGGPAVSLLTTASGSVPVITMVAPPVNVKEKIRETEKKVEDARKAIEAGVVEARAMVQSNNLLGALKKVDELHIVKQEAKNAIVVVKQLVDANVLVIKTAPVTGTVTASSTGVQAPVVSLPLAPSTTPVVPPAAATPVPVSGAAPTVPSRTSP